MTREELNVKIVELSPVWLKEEIEFLIYTSKDEDWDCQIYDALDALDYMDSTGMADNKYLRTIKGIEKKLGLWRKLGHGEQVTVMNSNGSKTMYEGSWVQEGDFWDLID